MFSKIFVLLLIVPIFSNGQYFITWPKRTEIYVGGKPHFMDGINGSGRVHIWCKDKRFTGDGNRLINDVKYILSTIAYDDKLPDDCYVDFNIRITKDIKSICNNKPKHTQGHYYCSIDLDVSYSIK
uniref:DUF3757 domain-containing protein n=1 Tax=Strongyloides venezuelensis TaxID=75913 RepID=A0A0K0FGI5_STRVS